MPTLFTIGYEGADPERFLAALRDAGVSVVADMRAVALSRKRGFSKNALRQSLEQTGLHYRHFIELGTPKAGREPVCLLCFERDPSLCHRRFIAERLKPLGFETVDLTLA